MPDMKTILVVDDEPMILKGVGEVLRMEGYNLLTADDGATALQLCRQQTPDLIVLDVMMPGLDGFEVCGRLRASGSHVPVMIVSARGDETDRVVGFRLGADDYLTKPFSIDELTLRVRAILRRAAILPDEGSANAQHFTAGEVEMDRASHKCLVRGKRVELTPREFGLLWVMATHPGQVFTRDALLERIWKSDFAGDQSTVTVYIRRLREKIERTPNSPQQIKTVWGIGYKFEP